MITTIAAKVPAKTNDGAPVGTCSQLIILGAMAELKPLIKAKIDITTGTCSGLQSIESINVAVGMIVTMVTAEKAAAIAKAIMLLKKYVSANVITKKKKPAANVLGLVAFLTYLKPSPAKIPIKVPNELIAPVVAVPPICFAIIMIDKLAM